jgi:hypothetical protein
MRIFRPVPRMALAATVLLGSTGATLPARPSSAGDHPLRLATIAVADRDTGIDVGASGLSAGDTETFLDDVQRNGQTVGAEAGSCTIITVSDSRLVAACTATLMLPEGQLTLQGVNDEDPRIGPTGFVWAVTGGTGRYATARGELVGTFRPAAGGDADVVDLEVRLR